MSPARAPVDGRGQRRRRNHQLIVDTCYELIRAGVVEPTADEVAERAGLGRRTVFRQFQDMEALARAVHERVAREVAALLEPLAATGDLAADLRAMVALRGRVFEHIAPFRRAAMVLRHRSAVVRRQSAMLGRVSRARLEAIVGPQLRAGDGDTLEALDLVLSFESWERLRREQQLSITRAGEIMLRAALALARPR